MNDCTNSEKKPRYRILDVVIFIAVAIIVLSVLSILLINIGNQLKSYNDAIAWVLSSSSDIDHAALIGYLRSLDFAAMKTSSLFFSFLIILIGALYVLRITESRTYFRAESENVKTIISTSSPGLVMIALGVILVIASLNFRSTITYESKRDQIEDNVRSEQGSLPLSKRIKATEETKLQHGEGDRK